MATWDEELMITSHCNRNSLLDALMPESSTHVQCNRRSDEQCHRSPPIVGLIATQLSCCNLSCGYKVCDYRGCSSVHITSYNPN